MVVQTLRHAVDDLLHDEPFRIGGVGDRGVRNRGVLKRRSAPKRHLAPVISSGGRREVKSLFTTAFDTAAIDRTWLVTFTAVRLVDIVSQDLGERDVRNLGGSRKYPICTFHILRTPSMVACHACKGRNRRQRHL